MNFSFASAPSTPFIAQTDGKGGGATLDTQLLSVGATVAPISAGAMATSRATDPLNDIGSPVNLQYLQFTVGQSPFMVNGAMAAMSSPSSVALNLPPKQRQSQQQSHLQHQPQPLQAQQQQQQTQAPQIQIMPAAVSPSSAAAASTLALVSNGAGMPSTSLPGFSQTPSTQVLSPMMEDPLPGFSHPAQVFRTPENRMLPDISTQATPVLALFEDADAIGGMRVLSPRTQTAQAGLSLLAASATYAHNTSSDMLGVVNAPVSAGATSVVSMGGSRSPMVDDRGMLVAETPFLNARGENATLMSQPQNSLTNHFSPPMVDRMSLQQQQQPLMPGMGQSLTTGRLVRNRSLLRQSSGLTSASFHNDLVPQANESFFAPLDEVCSDADTQQQQQQTSLNRQQQPVGSGAPRMGSQFSPVMNMGGQRFSQHLQPTLPPPPQRQRPWLSPNPSEPLSHHQPQRPAQQQSLPASSQYAVGTPMRPPSSVPHASNPAGTLPHRQNMKATPGAIFSQMPSLNNNNSRPRAYDDNWRAGSAHGSSDSQASDATSMTIDDEEMHSSGEMSGNKRRRTDGEGKTRHKRDQERRFDCDVCHRSFARQYNLKTHRLTHFPNAQASRPFKCAFCPKAFTRKHDLQRHSVLHERKDKHTCASCNRGFPRKDALKKHMETENCCPPV